MSFFQISRDSLPDLLAALYDRRELFWVNSSGEGKPRFSRAIKDEIPDYVLPPYRGVEPIKSILFPPKQEVAEYPEPSRKILDIEPKERAIFGITACDLEGIRIFDRVFMEDDEFIDPFYVANRKNLFIVTVDCTDIYPSCFCSLVGGQPFPENGFDINLTPVENSYLVETGTTDGEELIREIGAHEAPKDLITSREKIRKAVISRLEKQNQPFETPKDFIDLVTENQKQAKSYEHHGSTCVSCGACTYICPGCFCFAISDNPLENGIFQRSTTWDSCQFSGFSRMAGMLNPRGKMVQRFAHRYNHKFFHYPWRYGGHPACVGCGRCIDNCMGRIDMRATLRDLSAQSVSAMYPAPSPLPGENPTGQTDSK